MKSVTAVGWLVLTLASAGTAWGQPTAERPEPLSAEVRAAWERAGAVVGWMGREEAGLNFRAGAGEGKVGELPAFSFEWGHWHAGVIPRLPAPRQRFGLDLGGARVTDAGLKELAALEQLRLLDLRGGRMTDAGLKDLSACQRLQALDLTGTQVTDEGLKEIARLPRLQALYLNFCGRGDVTDAGLKQIEQLKELETLYLRNTDVTDAGLKQLAGLPQLQRLNVAGTRVTSEGARDLRSAVPGLRIER
jgi:hypothetical protein